MNDRSAPRKQGSRLVGQGKAPDKIPASESVATPAPPFPGMVKTEYGWARPCAACGSTDFGKPCPKTEDGFHVH